MSNFHLAFGVGFESVGQTAAGAIARDATFRQTKLSDDLSPESREIFAALIGEFARRQLGCVLVPLHDLEAAALALTAYKPRPDEAINWNAPLFDSDGYQHTLVSMGAIEVVTKHSFTFVTWDRKTGACKREGCADLVLSNRSMTPQERAERFADGEKAMQDWRRRSGYVEKVLPFFQSRPLAGMTDQQLQGELGVPAQMSMPVYLRLQELLEGQEMMAAQGHGVSEDFDEITRAVESLMNESPWTLHPDHGCIMRSDVEVLDRLEARKDRHRGG